MVRPCGLEAFGLEEGKDRNHRSEECGQHEDVANPCGNRLKLQGIGEPRSHRSSPACAECVVRWVKEWLT